MNQADIQLLREAIARNTGVVLSLPSAGMLRHYKSRFLGEFEGGIVLESPSGESLLLDALKASNQPCGVAFRKEHVKVIFAAPVHGRQDQWQINADTVVAALMLIFPTEIKTIQRRANYRVSLPPDSGMSVRIWRIGERAWLREQPMAAQEVKAQLRDLSVGGIGVKFIGKDGRMPQITPDDRLRVLLTFNDQTMILEGRMRSPSDVQPEGMIQTGVQFKHLEEDLKGRQSLAQITRIVGELQREEVRRIRLGLMKTA
jgi:c-di-GMP-binding flagellar brake protein YcgR